MLSGACDDVVLEENHVYTRLQIVLQNSIESIKTEIMWVKGHSGVPGNERADVLAGTASERHGVSAVPPLTQDLWAIRTKKEAWHRDPDNYGTLEIPPEDPE